MTDSDTDTTASAPTDIPPMTSAEAAEVVENDPALNKATDRHPDADEDQDES